MPRSFQTRQEDWEQHGNKIIKSMREKVPRDLFPKHGQARAGSPRRLGEPKAFDKPRTVEEALDQLEERVGTKGRPAVRGLPAQSRAA
jgi:hypothetical protein